MLRVDSVLFNARLTRKSYRAVSGIYRYVVLPRISVKIGKFVKRAVHFFRFRRPENQTGISRFGKLLRKKKNVLFIVYTVAFR